MNIAWKWMTKHGMSKNTTSWALSALMLAACGCSTGPRSVAKSNADPFLETETKAAASSDISPRGGPRRRMAARPESPIQQAGGEIEATDRAPRRRPRADSLGSRVDIADETDAAYTARASDGAIERVGGEMRLPDNPNCPCPCPTICEAPCAAAGEFPDEYICDGGDRDLPLGSSEFDAQGLDTEDAAIEYRDELDKRHVRPTNKVCIYAPRFASISTISEPAEDLESGRPVQAISAQLGVGMANRQGAFAQHQRDATERLVTRERGSAVETEDTAETIDLPVAPLGHIHTAYIKVDFSFLKTGQVKQADEARLATSITAAIVLSRDQNPVIAAKSEQGIELRSTFTPNELAGREKHGKGRLRVVKLADKTTALPGDIVTFTIRYDNIGDGEVHDVVIVDNLTPRLEYIEDSAECDVPGHFETEDNGEGSLILRWVLDEPVPGRTGGVVSFRALVR
jgi:uncharacterized repeat protein (TIGR01451 family)